jgi:hypothetical protein
MLNIAKPNKEKLDNDIAFAVNEVWRSMHRNHRVYQYYSAITDADLTAYGYNADDIYALRAACTALENLYLLYMGQTPLDTSVPVAHIDPVAQAVLV